MSFENFSFVNLNPFRFFNRNLEIKFPANYADNLFSCTNVEENFFAAKSDVTCIVSSIQIPHKFFEILVKSFNLFYGTNRTEFYYSSDYAKLNLGKSYFLHLSSTKWTTRLAKTINKNMWQRKR